MGRRSARLRKGKETTIFQEGEFYKLRKISEEVRGLPFSLLRPERDAARGFGARLEGAVSRSAQGKKPTDHRRSASCDGTKEGEGDGVREAE